MVASYFSEVITNRNGISNCMIHCAEVYEVNKSNRIAVIYLHLLNRHMNSEDQVVWG